MKKLCTLLFLISVVAQTWANLIEIDGINYVKNDVEKTLRVTYKTSNYNSYSGEVDIPSTVEIDGEIYTVTGIAQEAFKYCKNLTAVRVPDCVTIIYQEAFRGCGKLTSIHIPDGVTFIGFKAFEGCNKLKLVNIPEGITSIEEETFNDCSSLTSINIPERVTSIGSSAFLGCSSLTSITIPEGVTSIGSNVFAGCSSLTSINIPSSVIYLAGGMFAGCSSLTSINIPESVTEIGEGAFGGCSSLTSINIPESVTEIGNSAFSRCSSLTSINIPESVTEIGNSAFNGCSSLMSINIPDGIDVISAGVFAGCSKLTNITLPETVREIGLQAFYGCSSLTSINIPNGIEMISYEAFGSCSKLTNITLPETVMSIGECAFERCSSLTLIHIPEGITSISESAFYGCSSLTSITIPEGVTKIGYHVFDGCSKLKFCALKSKTPPEVTGALPTSVIVYIPCGYLAAYQADENWNKYNLVESNYMVELLSSNYGQGTVSYEGSLCAADGKVNLVATPKSTSQFVAWSDGNTENPRTVVIDKDTVFTAIFGDKPIIKVTSTKKPICDAYNGSITVSVSAGVEPYTYEWSDGGPAELSRTGLQSGVYTFKVTDAIGRFDELEINLESDQSYKAQIYPTVVNPICETKNGSIELSVSGGTAPYTYKWADSETTELTRTGLASGEYVFTVTDNAGCISEKKIELVKNEDNMPIIVDKVTNAICGQNIGEIELSISGGTEPYTYAWEDGSTSLKRTKLMPDTYSFSVTDSYGCKADFSQKIIAESFQYQPEIALVSVSQEVKDANLIVWQKEQTEALYYYSIYRETMVMGEYEQIAAVPYADPSIFVDEGTNNMKQSYKYKITATDFCGKESPMSNYHKTIHLQKGLSFGNAINLTWDGYEGFSFKTYSVYRVTTSGVEELTKVTADTWTYTDLNPVEGTLSYYVGVVLPNVVDINDPVMKAEGGPFVITISNIAEAENRTAVADFTENNYTVYANRMEIIVENAGNQKVIVCEATGKKVFEGVAAEIPVKTVGVYIVIVGNKTFKVVVN